MVKIERKALENKLAILKTENKKLIAIKELENAIAKEKLFYKELNPSFWDKLKDRFFG